MHSVAYYSTTTVMLVFVNASGYALQSISACNRATQQQQTDLAKLKDVVVRQQAHGLVTSSVRRDALVELGRGSLWRKQNEKEGLRRPTHPDTTTSKVTNATATSI